MRGKSSILKGISIFEGDFICDIDFLGESGGEVPRIFLAILGAFSKLFIVLFINYIYAKLRLRGGGRSPPEIFLAILGEFSPSFTHFSYRFESLRDIFFKMGDERDKVCAKIAPNPLRFQDALKNVILFRDIKFDF